MNLKILKRELKRKKSINLILLIFIMLATTFIAGSANNLIVITGGLDYFLDKSEIADFTIISAIGANKNDVIDNCNNIEDFLKNNKSVTKYMADEALYCTDKQIELSGNKKFAITNSAALSKFNIKQQKFFDKNNHTITDMADGTIYLSQKSFKKNHLKSGETIKIKTDSGFEKEFKIAGYCKDALLGSEFMGVDRFIISSHDYETLSNESNLPFGKIYSAFVSDSKEFENAYNNCSFNVLFKCDRALLKSTYVMNLVMAALFMLISLCLIAISIVMLRFTITFTVNEDYKEIGILKAIGIKDTYIRKLYLIKYLVIAITGTSVGFAASIPFSSVLLKSSMESMVINNSKGNILLELAVSIVIAILIILSGYLCTGKIKSFSPMDAIRNGHNGERFKKKGMFRLHGKHMKATTFMAVNDVFSEYKKYIVLLIANVIGIWMVIMPTNTINTLNSEKIGKWFSMTDYDIYIGSDKKFNELIIQGKKQAYYDYLDETKKLLEENDVPVERIALELLFNMKIRNGENTYISNSLQGIGNNTDMYLYDEGTPPKYDNEISITHIVADKINAHIGDTVYITIGDTEKPYIITAIYQSMINMGQGIRFTEDAKLDYKAVIGGYASQVTLQGNLSKDEISAIIKKVSKLMPEQNVYTSGEFIQKQIGGIAESLKSLKILILVIVISVNILIVVLMQKMFLIREKGEIGLLKAIGFSDRALIFWQTKRIILVQLTGILIGILTSTPFSQITSGQVFKYMGASKIAFEINWSEVYIIYPFIVFLATVAACIIEMLRIKRISTQEMNNIE
ncbi:MAG: ABC transporter permease [Lachnospiraceae bacterium]|nr:ABC transporter permease [Lachnospiraceae bacterium]MDE6252545.1 ABC transporter permease [Lachnospiraceae bacterium]